MRRLSEQDLAGIHLRNETIRYARGIGVKDRGIDILSAIDTKLGQWYQMAPDHCRSMEELYREFESLYPGVMASIQKHRISFSYPKGKPGRKRIGKIEIAT